MERIISLVLKEFQHENITIDAHDNFVKIITSSNSITINNRSREPKNGMYRSPRNKIFPNNKNHIVVSSPVTNILSQKERSFSLSSPHVTNKANLTVVVYDKSKYLYRELQHDFIVKQIQPGLIEVVGKLQGSEIIPLTPELHIIAHTMGLITHNNIITV